MDAARYYEFMGKAMMADAGPEAEVPPEMLAAVESMMAVAGESFSRFSVRTDFSDEGIELSSIVTLSE